MVFVKSDSERLDESEREGGGSARKKYGEGVRGKFANGRIQIWVRGVANKRDTK